MPLKLLFQCSCVLGVKINVEPFRGRGGDGGLKIFAGMCVFVEGGGGGGRYFLEY